MGKALDLPDAELEVLACLQKQGRATARQIRELIHRYRPLAHASVLTLLTRLEAKELVTRQKGSAGKAFVYVPTPRARRTGSNLLKKILQRVFHGDAVALVASLLQSRPTTAQEFDQLERLIAELRAQPAQGTPPSDESESSML